MVVANTQVDLAALKSRHSLGDVVEASGVQLRGRGRVRQGVCPFHQESEGSFTVYGDSERWYCFGCGLGGDVLDFIQRAEGLTLPEAIQRLGGGTGLAPVSAVRSATAVAPRRSSAAVVPQRDPAALSAATRFYLRSMLRSSEAREYLASRGISFDTACRLGLGYAPGDGLRRYLEAAGFGGERIRASGLFTERGERFAGMAVVPDLASGRVRWLVGRAIDPERSPRFQALPGPKPPKSKHRLGSGQRRLGWSLLKGRATANKERIVRALPSTNRVKVRKLTIRPHQTGIVKLMWRKRISFDMRRINCFERDLT